MHIYIGELTFHENLFYATREVGRLYETGRYLHNYALTYALGLATSPYFNRQQAPSYAADLRPLNDQGLYVTPALGLHLRYELNTFKYANNLYHVEMKPGSKNTPSYGRAKEIAAESVFAFAVLSAERPLALPQWVRMGLWLSKAHIRWHKAKVTSQPAHLHTADLPLNPLDLPLRPHLFDLVSMPPSSLLTKATLETPWWVADTPLGKWHIPQNLAYRFPERTF